MFTPRQKSLVHNQFNDMFLFCNRRYCNNGYKMDGAPSLTQSHEWVSAGIAKEKSAVFRKNLENG